MKILITAPSLDETENVSGISSVVRQIVKRSNHNFVHFQAGRRDGEKSGLKWMLKQALLVPRFKSEIAKANPDVVHINTSLVKRAIARDNLLAKAAKGAGKPVLMHVHGGPFAAGEFEWWHLGKELLQRADKVIVLSEREREAILECLPDLNIDVLPNAIAIDEIPERPVREGPPSIIYFGRLDKNKGLDTIVDACRELKEKGLEFQFNCYGTGPDAKEFIDAMLEVLDYNFYYGGVVKGEEKWRVLTENDIFLLPSRYEGLPMALLEAMAAGCVPVVSDVGSVSTVVENGVNGYLIDENTVAERLSSLISDPSRLNGLGSAARETIVDNFEISGYVSNLESIYNEISNK